MKDLRQPAVAATGVRKSFDETVVLDGVDLVVEEGAIFALLGPNGAGKTTMVRILSTLISADSGTLRVAGHDVAGNPDADRVRTLAALVAEGYTGQIQLGHDAGAFHDFMVGNPIFEGEIADWLHIPTTILPALLEAGVTQAQIDEMLLENPRRFFA